MRLFFATDIHGSETCWRKFLNSGKHYGADVIVLGGDMTGKALVPVVHDGDDHWHATLLENRAQLNGDEEVVAFEDAVVRRGYYPFRTTVEELRELEADETRWHRLFTEQMLKTIECWMRIADEKLEGSGIKCFVCPGNDDELNVDEVIRSTATHVELAEARVVEVDVWRIRAPARVVTAEAATSRGSPPSRNVIFNEALASSNVSPSILAFGGSAGALGSVLIVRRRGRTP